MTCANRICSLGREEEQHLGKVRIMPSFVQLERFVLSARLGSYKAAARKLYVTPQTVSKSVHDLEREMGVVLFEPNGYTLSVTPLGASILAYASDIIDDLDEIGRIIEERNLPDVAHGSAKIAVCSTPLRGSAFKKSDFFQFYKSYPQFKLDVSFHSSASCLELICRGIVDCGIVIGKPSDHEVMFAKLCSLPLQLLVSSRHPLSRCRVISFADLDKMPVALPYNLSSDLQLFSERARAAGASPSFESLEMRADLHSYFLHRDLGALLVCPDKDLPHLHPHTATLSFAAEEQIMVPYYFVWRKTGENPSIALVRRYLQTSQR